MRLASATPIASNGSRLTASSPYASSSSPLSSPSWPSSPYCPPSHDEMAISEQCSRESSALRSDYYSTTQKTANPLNEWWTRTECRDERPALRFGRPRVPRRVQKLSSRGTVVILRGSKKCLCHRRFRDARAIASRSCATRRAARIHGATVRRSAPRRVVWRAKKFSTGRVDRTTPRRKIAPKRANQCR